MIAPHLDGEYYGRLLPYIHEAVRERQSQLFAVQVADEYLGITSLEEPIAFELVDAWILILPSASASFLELLGKSDKPFVCVGFQSPYAHGQSVLVDNRVSMEAAVDHLIDHGHREIAFIGNLDQYDLHERYLGYRDALERRGLPFDERRVVKSYDNLVEGAFMPWRICCMTEFPSRLSSRART
ncbi:substrate-binding domain-containing protein [Cohnella cholangitidis]|uniref:substrate-binding domain-containing protein n=1 Tax=Cohnella cholangitidis TaxID=2598458 RepID=UPI0015FBE6B9|nr:substrate-binding domain-containing protein [Cohnella cholangitidis]